MRVVKFYLFMLLLIFNTAVYSAGENVYVIAKSISTSTEARNIIYQKGWNEANLREANFVLVVVRSSLSFPLSSSYDSISDLEKDADNQLNISGPNYVVYIFSLDGNLKPTELNRISYPVN